MTLILALKCKDAIVFLSDRQITHDNFKRNNANKLYSFGNCFAIGGAGKQYFIEEVYDKLINSVEFNDKRRLFEIKDQLQQIVKEMNKKIYSIDEEKFHDAKFIVCSWEKNETSVKSRGNIMLMDASGRCTSHNLKYEAIGSGREYAEIMLHMLYTEDCEITEAIRLGVFIIKMTADVCSDVDENIDVLVLEDNKVGTFDDAGVLAEHLDSAERVIEFFKFSFHTLKRPEMIGFMKNYKEDSEFFTRILQGNEGLDKFKK